MANDWDQPDSADQLPWSLRRQLSQTAFWIAIFVALALFIWFVTRWSGSTIHYAAATTNNTQKAQYGVSGQVVDAANGKPIPWATLIAHGITGSDFIHASADYGGSFTLITYPERQKLVVTADGYKPAELQIGPSWYMWNPHGKEQITVKLSLARPQ